MPRALDSLVALTARMALVGALVAVVVLLPCAAPARAFGDSGGFDPRVLLTGGQAGPAHPSAAGRWAWELVQRTSAPAKLKPDVVHADEPGVVEGPFLYWSGDVDVAPLTGAEIAGLRSFFALGGILLADDAAPGDHGEPGAFGRSARREIARVLPDSATIPIGSEHVVYRTFYLLRRAEGRVAGKPTLDAIVRGGKARVVFADDDLGGALARGPSGIWEQAVVPGGDVQREHAIRLAVNLAMYVLCSNYKDDQVHAPFLMRRRAAAMP